MTRTLTIVLSRNLLSLKSDSVFEGDKHSDTFSGKLSWQNSVGTKIFNNI